LEISHAIIDGTSKGIILRDLALVYDKTQHVGSATPYSEYISFLQNRSSLSDVEYWKSNLDDAKPCLFPIMENDSRKLGSLQTVIVKLDRLHDFQTFCERFGATLSNLVHTMWALTLAHLLKRPSVLFGYTTSGRDITIDGVQEAIGPYFNILPVRLDLNEDTMLLALLTKLNQSRLSASEHQICSMANVQRELAVRPHLFNTLFNFGKFIAPTNPSCPSINFVEHHARDPLEVGSRTRALSLSL
jgi:hypothetical protein